MDADARQHRGRQIKRARKVAGLTQKELATRVGRSESTIANIERGAFRNPDPATMDAIAAELEIPSLDDDPAIYPMALLPRRVQMVLNMYAGWLMGQPVDRREAELRRIERLVVPEKGG